MNASYILSDQASLFGQPDVVGFGNDEFAVKEIGRDFANSGTFRCERRFSAHFSPQLNYG